MAKPNHAPSLPHVDCTKNAVKLVDSLLPWSNMGYFPTSGAGHAFIIFH